MGSSRAELFAKAARRAARDSVPRPTGGGVADFGFDQIVVEEVAYAGVAGKRTGDHCAQRHLPALFLAYCNEDSARRWLPGIADVR